MSDSPNYYGIIPAHVRYDEDLRANAKLLYSELTCLSNKEGYCYSSNNYFAELYNVDPSTVSKWIKQLADKNYIRVEYIYDGKECKERRIFINNSIGIEPSAIGIEKNNEKVLPPVQEGYCKKNKVNNTSINNTSINNINIYSIKSVKHKYGEYKNVLLTEEEFNRFVNEYGIEKTTAFIQYFSETKEMKGYEYKSDNLALRKWGIKAYEEDTNRSKSSGNKQRDLSDKIQLGEWNGQ